MAKVGLDKLHYAIMSGTDEEGATAAPTYDAYVPLPNVRSINIETSSNEATLWGDNQPVEHAFSQGPKTVSIDISELGADAASDLLGQEVNADGVLLDKPNQDKAPWVAIAFRSQKANGENRYVTLYKGRFKVPSDNNESKTDSPGFQTDSVEATFIPRKFDGRAKATADSDYNDTMGIVTDVWFDSVYEDSTTTTA